MKKYTSVVAALIAVVGVAPWIVFWSSLPADVATHWDISGDPNGHQPRLAALLILGGISVALAVGALAQRQRPTARILAFVGAVIAFASLATVLANRDEPTWRTAHIGLLWVVVGVLAGAGAAWVFAHTVERPAATAGARPVIAIGESERVAWVGAGVSRWLQLTALAVFVFGVFALIALPEPAGVIVLLAALLVAHVSSVHVTITREGVRVRGAFGWPGVMLRTARIESADPIDVNPWQWGGWGYRGSLAVMRRAAWVLRRGPGLHLVLKGNKEFVVTVDDADEAAAVVNGLLTSTPR